jgi:hypothetical protein
VIRQAQRDKKGISNRPGPEDCGHNNVAHEAGDTREERKTADGENTINHRMKGPVAGETAANQWT